MLVHTEKNDITFWECLHASLRITLKHEIAGVTIYPTNLETIELNEITTKNPENKCSTERQPNFVAGLIIMIRMMEFNHQQDAQAFQSLFSNPHAQ